MNTRIDPTALSGAGSVAATRWASDDAAHRLVVDDPATGRPLCTVQGGGAVQVDSAVQAAHRGFLKWRSRPVRERAQVLRAIADTLRGHAEEIAALETRENGKTLAQARNGDVAACIAGFEFFAGLVERMPRRSVALGPVDSHEFLEPFGVIGGILPFNWPPIHFAAKVAPALAMGNAVVLKPGEQAPLTVMRLTQLACELLPDDVLHCVPGGAEAGEALARHPLVRKISFTGAPSTGTKVIQAAATRLTPTLMELGGKNPMVLFEDANLDDALSDVIEAAFVNKGEACTAASRILVQRAIYPEALERLARAVRRLCVGDGMSPETDVGPLVSRAQQHRVREYIALGLREGAELAAQAQMPVDLALRGGFFVPPTLLAGVTPGMRIAQEEIFGPVTCLMPFDTEEEAIAIANATDFGLVAAVYGADAARCRRVARGIEAGMVFINNYNRQFLGSPFGGTKASGYGREHSEHTLAEFGYLKAVREPSGRAPVPRWAAALNVTAPESKRQQPGDEP